MINEMGRTRLDVNVKIKSNVDEKLFALNLVVTIPMPPHTARADLQTTQGASLAMLSLGGVHWQIGDPLCNALLPCSWRSVVVCTANAGNAHCSSWAGYDLCSGSWRRSCR